MNVIHTHKLPHESAHTSLDIQRIIHVGESKTNLQTFNHATLPPGKSMEPHTHTDSQEIYYFLTGQGNVFINKKPIPVSKGDVVIINPHEEHGLENTSSKNLIYLSLRILV